MVLELKLVITNLIQVGVNKTYIKKSLKSGSISVPDSNLTVAAMKHLKISPVLYGQLQLVITSDISLLNKLIFYFQNISKTVTKWDLEVLRFSDWQRL